MTPQTYEKAKLASAVWRLAKSNDPNELLAVACTMRNHLVAMPGKPQTYNSFSTCVEGFLKIYANHLRPAPLLNEPAFVSFPDGLLSVIDDVYEFKTRDITATETTPGARFFAQASKVMEEDLFWPIVQGRQPVGTFGAQQFYE